MKVADSDVQREQEADGGILWKRIHNNKRSDLWWPPQSVCFCFYPLFTHAAPLRGIVWFKRDLLTFPELSCFLEQDRGPRNVLVGWRKPSSREAESIKGPSQTTVGEGVVVYPISTLMVSHKHGEVCALQQTKDETGWKDKNSEVSGNPASTDHLRPSLPGVLVFYPHVVSHSSHLKVTECKLSDSCKWRANKTRQAAAGKAGATPERPEIQRHIREVKMKVWELQSSPVWTSCSDWCLHIWYIQKYWKHHHVTQRS